VLSIELFANGRPYIVDPGSYAYNLDLDSRHEFRSTAYHSTVGIDGAEQNSISRELPFVIGNEAKPEVHTWESDDQRDLVIAKHQGFPDVNGGVVHERKVEFNKKERYWRIDDTLSLTGEHTVSTRFHLAPAIKHEVAGTGVVLLDERQNGLVIAGSENTQPEFEESYFSNAYGKKVPTKTLLFNEPAETGYRAHYVLVPFSADGRDAALELAARLIDNK
jgi:uncharacterized heparinase superfamily protein